MSYTHLVWICEVDCCSYIFTCMEWNHVDEAVNICLLDTMKDESWAQATINYYRYSAKYLLEKTSTTNQMKQNTLARWPEGSSTQPSILPHIRQPFWLPSATEISSCFFDLCYATFHAPEMKSIPVFLRIRWRVCWVAMTHTEVPVYGVAK